MDSILQQITDWLKEMLISAIMGNLSGMFESVNNQVGEIDYLKNSMILNLMRKLRYALILLPMKMATHQLFIMNIVF